QILQGVLLALAAVVGIAVVVSVAFMAAGALFERDQAPAASSRRPAAAPALQPTRTDRELVRR
ncbi:MAG: hypothetical protein WAK71_14350, partial [Streptosporangiaceae bacterium]